MTAAKRRQDGGASPRPTPFRRGVVRCRTIAPISSRYAARNETTSSGAVHGDAVSQRHQLPTAGPQGIISAMNNTPFEASGDGSVPSAEKQMEALLQGLTGKSQTTEAMAQRWADGECPVPLDVQALLCDRLVEHWRAGKPLGTEGEQLLRKLLIGAVIEPLVLSLTERVLGAGAARRDSDSFKQFTASLQEVPLRQLIREYYS